MSRNKRSYKNQLDTVVDVARVFDVKGEDEVDEKDASLNGK